MPANTPLFGFPYPLGTDRVMDGDNAMGALALAVEGQLSGGAGTTPGAPYRSQAAAIFMSNSLAANTGIVQTAITFAAGRFTLAPVVMCSVSSTSSYLAISHAAVTTSGCNLRAINPSNAVGVSVYGWIYAVQMTPTAASGFAARDIPEPVGDPYTATCVTEGCDNAGIGMPVIWDDPETAPNVACGVCGEPIGDVVAA
jgi:hypothetical protein